MAAARSGKMTENQRRIPQQARARQKVEAVLQACTQVLARKGYHKATILELSLESGVPVPTLYQYFANKEAIFIAWMERIIDQVLAQVADVQGHLVDADPAHYTDRLVAVALASVAGLRPSLRHLLSDLPQMLSARLVVTMENKTVAMIEEVFAQQIAALDEAALHFKLTTLVRLITGYFLQRVLNGEQTVDVERESHEISLVVKLYLRDLGVDI